MSQKKKMKIFGWDKPKTLYRFIKVGDLFCYQIAENLFGYGRIIARNKWGGTAEFYDYFTKEPVADFNYSNTTVYTVLFKCILDCVTLFQAKLDTEWRIIAQDPNYINPKPQEITSINTMKGIGYNADFSYSVEIPKDEALKRVQQNYELRETPRHHYHILDLLIMHKPEIFSADNAPYLGYDEFISKRFEQIQHKKLNL